VKLNGIGRQAKAVCDAAGQAFKVYRNSGELIFAAEQSTNVVSLRFPALGLVDEEIHSSEESPCARISLRKLRTLALTS
jgi:hypothetical protein